MKSLLVTICFLLGISFTCRAYQANDVAQTISSDGSYLDTSLAVGYVAAKNQGGWVLTVGAAGGTYTWTNQMVIGMPYQFTMQGASTNNRTTIIFNYPGNSGLYLGAGSNVVTIKDFIFNVGANGPLGDIIGIDGTGVCFRLTDCEFLNSSLGSGTAFGVRIGSINSLNTPGPFGLVDHCQFYFPGGVVYNYLNCRCNGNINGYGWTQPMSWGTTNSVVVESCAFSQPKASPLSGLCEADGAARITLRYCNITNIPQSTHGLNSGAHLSTLQIEVYQNNWVLNDTTFTMSYMYLQRGGTAVIWSNNVSTTSFWNLSAAFQFWVECASSVWSQEWCPSQLVYPANYPATQQIGQGVVNGAEGLVPVYIWGNHIAGTEWGNWILGMNTDAPFIQQGRDIYTNSVMPGYVPLVYPHPLVSSTGSSPGNFGGVTTNATVIPPTDLQAHPPAGQ